MKRKIIRNTGANMLYKLEYSIPPSRDSSFLSAGVFYDNDRRIHRSILHSACMLTGIDGGSYSSALLSTFAGSLAAKSVFQLH